MTWDSDIETIAIVDNAGLVTAIAAGTADIIVTTVTWFLHDLYFDSVLSYMYGYCSCQWASIHCRVDIRFNYQCSHYADRDGSPSRLYKKLLHQ